MKATRAEAYAALDTERAYQSGEPSDVIAPAETLSIGDEILLMEEYLLKARQAWAGTNKTEIDALHIVRKIGGMAVRCMETHGAHPRELSRTAVEAETARLERLELSRKIMTEVTDERAYQDERWGHEVDDTLNTPWMWASYICGYATKWMAGTFAPLGTSTTDAFRKAMIKTAAICIAAVESIDRQRAANGKTFYE